jgi:hypothetical protein
MQGINTFECTLYVPTAMKVLQFSPPFSYSYQCGSTLLITYIPVYLYSTSLQLLSIALTLAVVFVSTRLTGGYPAWVKSAFPRVFWLTELTEDANLISSPGARLLQPYQILSTVVNNLILLITFGLCSPVLGCSLALCVCARLWCWLMLIGRFVFSRLDQCSQSVSPPSFLVSTNPLNDGTGSEATSTNEEKVVRGVALGGDQLLSLLEIQLRDVNLALLVCRWPVVFTCVFFFTSICWDIAGDKAGWSGALWVPVVGVVILLALWLWERILTALLP